jgi:hypothetical protein
MYLTEKPVAEIVTAALQDTLAGLNYKLADAPAQLRLSGDLVRYESMPIMGFWSGALECSLQMNLRLTDGNTGNLVWSELISGYSKITGLQIDRAAHRTQVAEEALQDAMKKLSESATFQKAVASHATP